MTVLKAGGVEQGVNCSLVASSLLSPTASAKADCILQGVYRSFVQNAKFVNAASVPHIHFMASCVVEMFGLDMAASYQQAFSAIRQLAVLLRGALAMRTKDAFREVYCWQTVNCLELWAKLLAAHADKQVSLDYRPWSDSFLMVTAR